MNFKLIKILFLTGILFNLFSISLAEPLQGQSYPYILEVRYGSCESRGGDQTVGETKTADGQPARICLPGGSILAPTSGKCNEGFESKRIPEQDKYYCIPIAKSVSETGGVEGLKCPPGSHPNYGPTGIATFCSKDTINEKDCPNKDNIIKSPNTGKMIGCRVAAESITGIKGFYGEQGKIVQEVIGYKLSIDIPCQPIAGGQCPKLPESGPAGYVARLYQFGLMIAGLLAFAGIIYGSVKYILSAGNMASLDDAKEQIRQAIYGLLLLLGAFIILYTINPTLVQLRNPEAPIINVGEIIARGKLPPPEQRLTDGGGTGAGGDPLCSAGSYNSISVTLGTGSNFGSFTCQQCVNGASKAVAGDSSGVAPGKCHCAPGFAYSDKQGQCIFEEELKAEAADSRCTAAGGVCQINSGSASCPGGSYTKGLCSGPTNRQCCIK